MKHLRIKTKHFQRAALTLLTLVMAFTAQTAWADYGWNDASMSIGGITTDFTTWSTDGANPTDLGNLTNMTITSIAFNVWSDANDRGGANMYFRIWDGGSSQVGADQDLWLGSATRIAGDHDFSISWTGTKDLASAVGLTLEPGKTYYIDMWAKTYGNSVDEWYSGNNGSNYHAKLSYNSLSYATVTGINASYGWTGSAIHPVPVVKLGETELISGTDYDVTYSAGCIDGGDYTVTITGKGNYGGTKVVNFSILVPTGYYLVGDMNGWGLNPNYILAQNTVNTSEYYINNVTLAATDGIKVVRTDDGKTKNEYFPGGENPNYIPGSAGKYFVYFRPNGDGGNVWYSGYIYATTTASVDVNLAGTGYGTYYNSTCEVTLPTGVAAYVLNEVNGTAPTYEMVADGDGDGTTVKKTVPAGVAVLLYSASKPAKVTLNLNTATSDSRTFDSNKLHGSDVAIQTTGGGEGDKYYKLTYNNSNKEKFGWFWGAENGGAFTSPAHKAWLVLPATVGARTFLDLPGEDVTGIATIENRQQNADNVWYDLNGRRINAPTTKGIYVKDGRKFVIK